MTTDRPVCEFCGKPAAAKFLAWFASEEEAVPAHLCDHPACLELLETVARVVEPSLELPSPL